MRDPRPSYRKTILASSLAAGAVLILLGAWALAGSWRGPGGHALFWLGWAGAGVVLALVLAALALVAAGGLIALRRTRLEERGIPYARAEGREWLPGPSLRLLRNGWRRFAEAFGRKPRLLAGDVVEVRPLGEILATLDDRGMLEGLPFMPEMTAFCGRRLTVFRRVEKIHDYVLHTGLRRLRAAVLLTDVRCAGTGHGGCQAHCHLIWKEAWLRRLVPATRSARGTDRPAPAGPGAGPDLDACARRQAEPGPVHWVCQTTQLPGASTPMSWADPRHYLRDLISGNVRLMPWLRGVSLALFNGVQRRRGGLEYPHYSTTGLKTSPHATQDLQPGELVRVRTKREIEDTLSIGRRNRGLWFDGEMLRYCGGYYRVAARIERLIDERSGRLIALKTPSVTLEGISASGEYLALCPQNETIFWREIWLERVEPPAR